MTGEIWSLFGTNLLVMVVVMSLLSLPAAFKTKDPSYVDAFWGIGFVVIAFSTYLQTDGDPTRSALLLGLTALWGFRLGGYLLWRWRQNGPDPRYVKLYGPKAPAKVIWLRVFVLQAVLLTIVSVPVQLGQVYAVPEGLTALNTVGLVLAVFGIAYEAIADFQLVRFKADPANHGLVMDKGLWHNTRHPNYFGEACTWWGLFLVAFVNVPTFFAILGPLAITGLLLKVSGVGLLEAQLRQSKPKYVDYIATTSSFIPLPKRKAAPVDAEAGA